MTVCQNTDQAKKIAGDLLLKWANPPTLGPKRGLVQIYQSLELLSYSTLFL